MDTLHFEAEISKLWANVACDTRTTVLQSHSHNVSNVPFLHRHIRHIYGKRQYDILTHDKDQFQCRFIYLIGLICSQMDKKYDIPPT